MSVNPFLDPIFSSLGCEFRSLRLALVFILPRGGPDLLGCGPVQREGAPRMSPPALHPKGKVRCFLVRLTELLPFVFYLILYSPPALAIGFPVGLRGAVFFRFLCEEFIQMRAFQYL